MTTNSTENNPKDFFLNLLSIITLYISAISFTTLLFQSINFLFPDSLGIYRVGGVSIHGLRFAVASLLVVFPVYIWSVWFLERGYRRNPDKKVSGGRKWMVYFTLFIAAIIIIIDFITLILRFLEGELTVRFLFKIIAILFVAGVVFGYYLWDLKHVKQYRRVKIFSYTVIGIVIAGIIASFFIIGSPARQRSRLFDEQRVRDLQSIQSEVIVFWQGKDRLPGTLGELDDDLRGIVVPVDPETKEQYTYKVLDGTTFELCATFNISSDDKADLQRVKPFVPQYKETWKHGAGNTCFNRKIDKELYNKNKNNLPEPTVL